LAFEPDVKKILPREADIHPAAPTVVNGVSTTPLLRRSPPSTSLPQDMKDSQENMVRGKGRFPSLPFFPFFPFFSFFS
jgi:hypothetical protein